MITFHHAPYNVWQSLQTPDTDLTCSGLRSSTLSSVTWTRWQHPSNVREGSTDSLFQGFLSDAERPVVARRLAPPQISGLESWLRRALCRTYASTCLLWLLHATRSTFDVAIAW